MKKAKKNDEKERMIITVESTPKGVLLNDCFPSAKENAATEITEITRVDVADGLVDHHKVISFNDISLYYINIDCTKEITFKITTDAPAVQMMFTLSTNFLLEVKDNLKESLNFSKNQHNLLCYPNLNAVASWMPGMGQEYIEIFLPQAFFLKYVPLQRAFESFFTKCRQKEASMLSRYNMPITPEMMIALRDIIQNNHKGAYKRMAVEARIIELLMLQMEQYEMLFDNPVCCHLRKSDINRIYEARDVIMNNLSNPCSLIDLAHKVGTNEYNLKKGFKEVFGTTVFGYLNSAKMERAKNYLLSKEFNVNEVADMMGYNDATNFTAAFKKHFGVTPGRLVKGN